MEKSEKAMTSENVKVRSAQSNAGKVRLSDKKEYTIKADGQYVRKGQKKNLNAATYEVFKAKGLV